MKTISIEIRTERETYNSKFEKYTEDELKEIRDIVEKASSGKLNHLCITDEEGCEIYFSEHTLERSIIKLVFHNSMK